MENLISKESLNFPEISRLFTKIQLGIIKKRLENKKLNSNEQTYYYKYIKPKIRAIFSFCNIDELNISGKEQIIAERIPKAIALIKKLSQKYKNRKIMISGSFLFNKAYNDIDVFIFQKYDKQDFFKGKLHITFLPEEVLDTLFFASVSKISVSNFRYEIKRDYYIEFQDLIGKYEFVILSIIQDEEYKNDLRNFLLNSEYFSKKVVLNGKQLYELAKNTKKGKIIRKINRNIINALLIGYTAKMKKYLAGRIKLLAELKKEYKNSSNATVYIQAYKRVISIES